MGQNGCGRHDFSCRTWLELAGFPLDFSARHSGCRHASWQFLGTACAKELCSARPSGAHLGYGTYRIGEEESRLLARIRSATEQTINLDVFVLNKRGMVFLSAEGIEMTTAKRSYVLPVKVLPYEGWLSMPLMDATADIAIIGMACPRAGARDYHAFWSNILTGKNLVADASEEWCNGKFDPTSSDTERIYTKRVGQLRDLAEFDPLKFGVVPNAVQARYPTTFLHLSWPRQRSRIQATTRSPSTERRQASYLAAVPRQIRPRR